MSKRPRDESHRVALITEAVCYCQRVVAMGMPPSCYTEALREPVYYLWEAYGRSKADAAQFRSAEAVGLRHGMREVEYDHAVPFRYLQRELLELRPATPETVEQVLRKYETRVLVTKAEHGQLKALGLSHTMPDGWDGTDPLARYAAAGIRLLPNTPEPRKRKPTMSEPTDPNAVFRTERVLSADPRTVFAAFENPERLAAWWGPKGFTNTFERFEFAPGGRWAFVMHGPNGIDYRNESVFRELEPAAKVVIGHLSQPRYTLTVTLDPRGEGTHLTWTQEFESAIAAERLRHIVEPANEQNLNRLETVLAEEC